MSEDAKKYIKVYCKKTKRYGMITTDKNNGAEQITNFYEIDDDTAKNIETAYTGTLPPVSSALKACAECGKRTARCCDKTHKCKVGKGELWYQCLYCSGLEICGSEPTAGGSADIYFLMDQSGSMSDDDRRQAANAVRAMVQSLEGSGNAYHFVAWASDSTYIFRNETNLKKMSSALYAYENETERIGYSTDAAKALRYIKSDVLSCKRAVRILLVTDGGFDNTDDAVAARNELLANKNVEILAIGVTGAVESALRRVGTVAAFSKVVGGSAALTSTFEEIAEALKKKGNNF